MDGVILGTIVLLLALLFYMLPTLIANQRDVNNLGTIAAINLVFGWTVLGWFAALIWAVVEQPKPRPVVDDRPLYDKPLPNDGQRHPNPYFKL